MPYPTLPSIADEFDFMAERWKLGKGGPQENEFISKAKNADAVILNAEGSMYRNNYTAIKGLFLLWYARTQLNRPSFFLNGSIALTNIDPILPAMVRNTFREIDGISIREPVSIRNLLEFFPEMNARLVPDSVFYLFNRINEQTKNLSEDDFFAFSPSMLITAIPGIYNQHQTSLLFKVVTELKKMVPQAVILAREPRDRILKDLAKDTCSIYFGPENSPWELINILKRSKFLLSGRYHHIILASILGVPSLPLITTSPKIQGLCELLNGEIGKPLDSTNLMPEIETVKNMANRLLTDKEIGERLHRLSYSFSQKALTHLEIVTNSL